MLVRAILLGGFQVPIHFYAVPLEPLLFKALIAKLRTNESEYRA